MDRRQVTTDFLKEAHSLLVRQLSRSRVHVDSLSDETLVLLQKIDRAYKEFDDDRRMLERSIELSSHELMQANAELRSLLSERKEAEKQMEILHAQKLEATGLLAGGVAHDFNNLLAIIQGSCDHIIQQTSADDPRRDILKHIDGALKHAVALTRQLLAFSRRQVLKPRVIDLNQTIGNMESILRPLVGQRIELCSALDPSLPPIIADPAQIEQVVMNLVVNARDAMPQGGRLELQTARASPSESRQFGVSNAPHVRLSVKDTGSGMSPEVKSRIFEPFFTTKRPGKGTGLGLSTVYGVVRQSGGFIAVESEVARGTSFHIYLPEGERAPS